MNAEIMAVGTELLMGQIANTNAQYISNKLNLIGINVYYHSVVGDNADKIKKCMAISLERSEILVITGGLGPTRDDLTKEVVSEFLGKDLVLHEESFFRIKRFFQDKNREMTKNNEKQAYLPKDCYVINNDRGTAPGAIINEKGKIIVMLPGPPYEMSKMLDETVIPYLKEKSEQKIESVYIKIFGMGESQVAERISDLIENQVNPTIAPYAGDYSVTLRVTAKCEKHSDAMELIEPIVNEIKKRLGDVVYSIDNKELEEVVGEFLISNNISISIAESCTGGLLSSYFTSVPGISSVFKKGVITYSNESKMKDLGVNEETLKNYGAVSKETAIEMAKGVRESSNTDIGLSVTGIAGPGGGTQEKPVGLVYIAIANKEGAHYNRLNISGDRDKVRKFSALSLIDMLRTYLSNSFRRY